MSTAPPTPSNAASAIVGVGSGDHTGCLLGQTILLPLCSTLKMRKEEVEGMVDLLRFVRAVIDKEEILLI